MKTQVTLTIDSDVKEKFQALAKKMWSNMSTLANMYFTKVIHTWKLEYFCDSQEVDLSFIPYEKLSIEDKASYDRIQKSDKNCFINI